PDLYGLVDAAQKVLDAQPEYSRCAREQAIGHFDIQKIAAQYRQVLLEEE
ncbi:MAG: hypothetical protein GYA58_05240, partial [Anaerolineaceae bacterium]|nr:hypothetical protein [Anaerolineaceae bacterium]